MGLISILFLISVPVFYVYGVICFFRQFGNKKTVDQIPTTPTPSPLPVSAPVQIVKPEKHIDNVNVVLYLGAFLIIVACGIFATYSYANISDLSKALLMFLFASGFYLSGLLMYKSSEKIKPAAIVFSCIGLISYPLVGLVASNLSHEPAYLRMIWFLTSLVCAGLYYYANGVIRHTLLDYLVVFTSLSLFQSTIGLFNLPVHYYYWGLAIFAMINTILNKTKLESEPGNPTLVVSQVLLPVALVFSLTDVVNRNFLQSGITFALATGYYGMLAYIYKPQDKQQIFAAIAALTAPISIGFIGKQVLPNLFSAEEGLIFVGLGITYALIAELLRQAKRPDLELLFAAFGSGLAGMATVFTLGIPAWYLSTTVAWVVLNYYFYYRTKHIINFGVLILSALVLPHAITQYLTMIQSEVALACMYLTLLVIPLSVREHLNSYLKMASYAIFLIASIYFAFLGQVPLGLLVILISGGVWYGLCQLENEPKLKFISVWIGYIAVASASMIYKLTLIDTALGYLLTATAVYLINLIKPQNALVISALFGSMLGFYLSCYLPLGGWLASIALVVTGGMIVVEGMTRKMKVYIQTGVAIVLAGIQFYAGRVLLVDEMQFYMLGWAAYAWWIDIEILALALATVPMGVQALTSQVRGVVLIGEGLALVFAGLHFRRPNVWRWGCAVLVAEVIYYTRGILLNLPGWVIFGTLGILLLSGSIYILQKRK